MLISFNDRFNVGENEPIKYRKEYIFIWVVNESWQLKKYKRLLSLIW